MQRWVVFQSARRWVWHRYCNYSEGFVYCILLRVQLFGEEFRVRFSCNGRVAVIEVEWQLWPGFVESEAKIFSFREDPLATVQ